MKEKIVIFWGCFLFAIISEASTYIPCDESENGSCWSCGETCAARLTYETPEDAQNQTNATLTFSGTGAMDNYKSPYTESVAEAEPWWDVRDSIKKVVVEDGLTTVGNRTIYAMSNLKEVSLPDSVTSIGMRAFFNSSGLENLTIPETVTSIGNYAFQNTRIQELVIPENVSSLAKSFLCESEEAGCVALPLDKIYCATNNAEACASAVAHLGITPTVYETTQNGQIFYNNQWYHSANDILSGNHVKKRIYTVNEATKVSKDTGNTFKLRYK